MRFANTRKRIQRESKFHSLIILASRSIVAAFWQTCRNVHWMILNHYLPCWLLSNQPIEQHTPQSVWSQHSYFACQTYSQITIMLCRRNSSTANTFILTYTHFFYLSSNWFKQLLLSFKSPQTKQNWQHNWVKARWWIKIFS